MARPSCSSGDGSSSPIPLIGLYIAAATAVCFLLMLCDVVSSVRHKTRYIPCKWFSLNSTTLTLLAIASKLPVDLTTYMPSAGDQLSKLSGTTMVCISMCFLMPSIGINREAESVTNMIALSLFVVTIAVNICIQILTGVIFLFIIEHIIILCCILMLLTLLWAYTSVVNNEKPTMHETMRNTLKKGEASSLLHQVKLWYMSSCISNPQYLLRGGGYCLSVVMICFLCLTVLSQAALRLLIHKFEICDGTSDYGWSISIILVTQTSTVVVISISTAFRWIVIVSDPPFHWNSAATEFDFDMHFEVEIFSFLSLVYNRELRKFSILFSLYLLLKGVVVIMTLSILYVLAAPVFVIRLICIKIIRIFHAYCPASSTSSSTVVVLEKWKTELREVFHPTKRFPKWIMRSRVEDMNKWINLSNRSPPNYLVQLLSRPHAHPPQTLSNKLQQIGAAKGYYKLSCLSVVILAKIVALSIPFHLAKTLMQAVDEAFEIAYYIDKKINVGNFQDGMKRRFAKVLLAHKNVHLSKNDSSTRTNMSVDEALSSIENECKAFPNGLAKQEMEIMRHFIDSQDYASIGELYEHLEQLFVDMLFFFLPQLPIVIFKEVHESAIEVHEERARFVLKLLCKLKLLEDKVQWLFPEGCHVTRLMDPEEENNQAGNMYLHNSSNHTGTLDDNLGSNV